MAVINTAILFLVSYYLHLDRDLFRLFTMSIFEDKLFLQGKSFIEYHWENVLQGERVENYQPLQKAKSLKHEPQRCKETKKSSSLTSLCLRGRKKETVILALLFLMLVLVILI